MSHNFPMNETFTKVDNAFLDEVMRHTSTHGEMLCCMIIFRKTIGWGKKNANISISTFQELGGIKRRETVIASIKSLRKKGIIKTKKSVGKVTNFTLSYQYGSAVPVRVNETTGLTVPVPVRMKRTHKRKVNKYTESESNDVLISEEQKQKFISFTMAQADIKSPQGYELSMRRKLLKNDPATMEIFFNWQKSYLKAKAFDDFCSMYVGKRLETQVKDEVLSGEIREIYRSGGNFVVSIVDGDDYKSIRYSNYEDIRKHIQGEAVA